MDNYKRKQVTIFSLTILFLALIAFAVFYLVNKKEPVQEEILEPKKVDSIVRDAKVVEEIKKEKEKVKISTVIKKDVTEDELVQMAVSFVERFGTYSNQANYDNFLNLKPMMSPKMIVWADKYVADQRLKNKDTSRYYAITTKVVATEVEKFDDNIGKSFIVLSTRRRETLLNSSNTLNSFNQEIKLSMVKIDKVWKVTEAFWQNSEK